MKKVFLLGLCVALAGALGLGCDDGGENCIPHAGTVCTADTAYWTDSCGNQEEVREACRCGCDANGLLCQTPCNCVPDCTDKECGDDGCQGSCGDCTAPEVCNASGVCETCAPDCTGKECGDDGCGGSCGTCGANEACDGAGQCQCVPACTGKECGDDGCGATCAPGCGANETCDAAGQCICTPDCTGKACGDDGCGGSCGTCDAGAGQVCVIATGQCIVCTVNCTGLECGPDPTCGASCGDCTAPETCDGAGQCACVPACGDRECGLDPVCGTLECGTCTGTDTCDADGQCQCTPNCTGKECGNDGCGGSCGACEVAGEYCDGTGTCVAGGACPNGSVTIMQIQDVNAAGHPAEDTEVCVQGVVVTTPAFTMSGSPAFYVQDAAGGQFSGVVVWAENLTLDAGVVQGATLAITGTINEYYDLTELVATQITVMAPPGALPAPAVVTPGEIMTGSATAEAYEGVLVRVQNVETMVTPFPGNDGVDHGDFQVANQADPSNLLVVGWQFRYPFSCPTPCATDQRAVGQQFMSITGVMDYSFSNARLQPRYDEDIELHVDPNDTDGDGVVNAEDNCPNRANPLQENGDADTFGDACDNCPADDNEDQADADGDGIGDVCEQVVTGTHLILSEVCVQGNGHEFIEIHNPTDAAIDLAQYYLWDANYPTDGVYYWLIATLATLGVDSDFVARFPDGSSIGAGETKVIAVSSVADILTNHGVTADYALRGDGAGNTLNMVQPFAGSVGANCGLSNAGEVVVLFKWDGAADLVQDADYFIWGVTTYASSKTGVTVGASTYLADTDVASQTPAGTHANDQSLRRMDFNEGAEVKTGGNGIGGHNETSEDMNNTWQAGTPTPGAI
ncbi:MAG TPA: lamin tail domain-containing protein [Myxococcota bacterium]|nr:lamin tail domain-containing protein [Myxococcota bacterium]HRY93163.1 lamin tail domain-containing protein [Myxococcota bacterium]